MLVGKLTGTGSLKGTLSGTGSLRGTLSGGGVGHGIPSGGEPGQGLIKVSDADYDVKWMDILPEDTASGSVASFPDGADDLPMGVVVDIDPVQDLHGYDNPWPEGGGKNKLKYPYATQSGTLNGITFSYNSDGSVNLSGTATATTYINFNSSTQADRHVIGSGTQRITSSAQASYNPQITGINFQTDIYKDGTYVGTVQNGNTGLTVSDATEIAIGLSRLSIASGTVIPNGTVFYPQIEFGTEQTSWTPYSNICPISGWTGAEVTRTGANVWDEEWEGGYYLANNGAKNYDSNYVMSKNKIRVIPNTTYYVCSPIRLEIFEWGADGSYLRRKTNNISNAEFTTSADCYYTTFDTYVVTTTYAHNISINRPSSVRAYNAYQGQTITVQLGQTVYGGKLNVETGELVVDRTIDVITKNGAWYSFSTGTGNASAAISLSQATNVKYVEGYAERNGAISSTGKEAQNYWVIARQNEVPLDGDMCFAYSSGGQVRFHRTDVNAITDLATFKDAFPDTEICYPLATPITLTLTPVEIRSLLGDNNVWADTGDVSVTYKANIQGYIDKKISAAVAAMS